MKHLPLPPEQRRGTALCLSGGGFRAALFQLGALTRLNELRVLPEITTITSVSGGSIIAAHLAHAVRPWPSAGQVFADWNEAVVRPLRLFMADNIRTPALLSRLSPLNWFRPAAAAFSLAARYDRLLKGLHLTDLPQAPNFMLCATDMVFGVNWTFERDRMGSYMAGYVSPPPEHWTLGRAVAASSCFPPIFSPLPVDVEPDQFKGGAAAARPDFDALIRGLRLTDGGNYDNMGLEPAWKTHRRVLVCDGGAVFEYSPTRDLFWRLSRYVAILADQVDKLRMRWLISDFITGMLEGAYWGIGSAPIRYGQPGGYPKQLAREVIAPIRTDMDAFSDAEMAVLENHGYLLADAAVRCHLPDLIAEDAPLSVPHPDYMDEHLVRELLADSRRRRLFGRWRSDEPFQHPPPRPTRRAATEPLQHAPP